MRDLLSIPRRGRAERRAAPSRPAIPVGDRSMYPSDEGRS